MTWVSRSSGFAYPGGYETMRLAGICAATLATSILFPTTADAIKQEIRGGVHGAAGSAWFDQTAGQPVVSFPLGCTTNCHFSLWFEYVPEGENPKFTDIFHRPVDDPDDPLLNSDRCVAWTRLGSAVQPIRSGIEHFVGGGVPSDDSMLAGGGRHPARPAGPGRAQLGITGEPTIIVGNGLQYFEVGRWSLLVAPSSTFGGNCLFTFRACYYPNYKTFDEQAKKCPLSE